MRFGIQHAVGDPAWTPGILAPSAVADFARLVEVAGFDLLAFTDHPAPSQRWVDAGGEGVADPVSSLGFCAAVTSTIRLMTFVWMPSYRNPFAAAHQFATLDVLSGGRLIVGLGSGYLFSEFRALGVDPARRLELFDEHVDLMRRAWSGEAVTHRSDGVDAGATRVLPSPVQQPHPPLWIHGNSPWGTRRAVAYGDGWLGMLTPTEVMSRTTRTTPIPDVAALAPRIAAVRQAAAAAGRDPGSLQIVVAGAWPMLDLRSGRPAARYLEEVATLEALGVDWVISLVCGDDPTVSLETVQRFGEDVIAAAR